MVARDSWDHYFMRVAREVATRATCDRCHVGAVIVSPQRTIVSTGYNGSMRGAPHCDDAGHLLVNGSCVRTVHAEMNALLQAAAGHGGCRGATLYSTALPCRGCAMAAVNAGIVRIVYADPYRFDPERVHELRGLGVVLEMLDAT